MDMVIKFLVAAVLAGTPLLYGTVGEILSEKTGHLNLGVEGMMSIGACAGFMAGYQTDSLVISIMASDLCIVDCHIYGKSERNGSDTDDLRYRTCQLHRCYDDRKITGRYFEITGAYYSCDAEHPYSGAF